jgi:hypothetical protein
MITCHKQTLPVSQNYVNSQCTVVLLSTLFIECVLLSATQTAEDDFSVKWCLRMDTHCAREYMYFVSKMLLASGPLLNYCCPKDCKSENGLVICLLVQSVNEGPKCWQRRVLNYEQLAAKWINFVITCHLLCSYSFSLILVVY